MILSNDGFVAFHYRSYGTFFLHKIGSIISIGDLPTTNIIEPFIFGLALLLPSLALMVRRLRDAGFHWALIFILFVPLGSIVLLVLFAMPTKETL